MTSVLGDALRAWRDQMAPESVGFVRSARRRTVGLRREEVAQLAGVSADYLVRLEQGRSTSPSVQVVDSLARALRLDAVDRDQLYRLAGHLPPTSGQIDRHVTPSVLRMVERFADLPVTVIDASWDVILQNSSADALFGPLATESGRARNVAWRTFIDGPTIRGALAEDTLTAVELDIVGDLHDALLRYPEDVRLASLVADLREASPRFAELWETTPPRQRGHQRKTLIHSVVGEFTADCDVLTVRGSDLQLVVFSAEPGTPDADALALAVVVGAEDMSVR
jgi:transcriptional regulator with XRE-family HTH domain